MLKQMNMKIENGTMKGITHFDNEIGLARKMEMNQSMDMSMTNPQDGSEMKLPTKQTITLKLDKVGAVK
jgi:hypothetical protein